MLELVLPSVGERAFPHAEERRLFYVAATRAKYGVYLVSHSRHPSTFVREVLSSGHSIRRIRCRGRRGTACLPEMRRSPSQFAAKWQARLRSHRDVRLFGTGVFEVRIGIRPNRRRQSRLHEPGLRRGRGGVPRMPKRTAASARRPQRPVLGLHELLVGPALRIHAQHRRDRQPAQDPAAGKQPVSGTEHRIPSCAPNLGSGPSGCSDWRCAPDDPPAG